MRWISQSQNSSASNYYFRPYIEDAAYQRLYIYRLSEVEKHLEMNAQGMPEDLAALYSDATIPAMMILDYVGEN